MSEPHEKVDTSVDPGGAPRASGPSPADGHAPIETPVAGRVLPPTDVALVRRLVATQFPRWADLPVRPVEFGGWDNRTFHLGDEMTVRLPSGDWYAGQVAKEQRWLPVLAPRLPLPVPTPLAQGEPAFGYPYQWSVYRWIEGETVAVGRVDDPTEFAVTLADFLAALRRCDPTGGPEPGPHSCHRGAPVATYDAETRRAVEALGDRVPGALATEIWEAALAAGRNESPVWFHGDVSVGNLLVEDGRLSAVIDFGCSGVGDPACDTTIAWTFLSGESREAFRETLGVDPATWARGRGWALWKALIMLAEHIDTGSPQEAEARRVLDAVFREYGE